MSTAKPTDWIQAGAVVIGVAIAIYELFLNDSISRRERAAYTAELLAQRSSPEILKSFTDLMQLAATPDTGEDAAWNALIALTPFHEYLLQWAICYDHSYCDRGIAVDYACPMSIMFEATAETAYRFYGLPFTAEKRPLQQTALWTTCTRGAK